MTRYPKLGLFGGFSPCEPGILAAINDNFQTLDAVVQLSVIDFVTELPEDPFDGDTYILESGIYTYDGGPGSIMVWYSDEWHDITPFEGWEGYVESEGNFFYFNGSGWVERPVGTGDVVGPASSLNNSVARFDGITGKFIQDSGVIIDDDEVMTGLSQIYSDTGVIDDIKAVKVSALTSSLSTAGTSVALAAPTTLVTRLTGALVSVNSITAPPTSAYGRLQIYVNKRGSLSKIKFINGSSIRTGTGSDLDIADGAAIWMYYDPSDAQWVIVGGSGGVSTGTVTTIATLTAGGTIPLAADINDQSFLIEGATVPVTLNSIPFTVATTIMDATMIYLIGTSDTKPVTITYNDVSGGLVGNFGEITLHKNEVAVFKRIAGISRYVYVP